MSISNFAIKKPVTTMMIVIVMVVAGVISLFSLQTALLPDYDIPVTTIVTQWSGASPEDVEKQITKEIEDSLSDVSGISDIMSYSMQDTSQVIVKFEYGLDNDEKAREVQTEIDKIINDLPDDADTPLVSKVNVDADPVITYYLSGSDLIDLYDIAENKIKPYLEKITGIGDVDIYGGLEQEILVELDPDKIKSYNLDISTIYSYISLSNINIPSGEIQQGGKEYIVRLTGELESVEQIKNIVISNNDAKVLRLKDVASVKMGTKDLESYARNNGVSALSISVTKATGGNLVDIARDVKEIIAEQQAKLPENLEFLLTYDASVNINNSISTVRDNALVGLLLASIILFVFLKNFGATLIVAIAIPVSVIFTFFLISMKGITLNIISLMGLALGVGMLVDNSIVIIDNIFRHMTELGKTKFEAARDGASEMAIPILASTLTTVAAFLPIVVQDGLAKEMFHDMSWSISFALLASFIIAVTFVPMAATKIIKEGSAINSEGKILRTVKKVYSKVLIWALGHRIILVVTTFVMLIASAMLFGTFGKTEFFPSQDQSIYTMSVNPAAGLNLEKVNEIALEIEEIVKNDPYTVGYSTTVEADGFSINVYVPQIDERENGESISEIVNQARPKYSHIRDAEIVLKDEIEQGPPSRGGGVISLQLFGDDYNLLKEETNKLVEVIEKNPEFVDVSSTYAGGNPQARIVIDRTKAQYYGLRVSTVALDIAYQIDGEAPVTIKTESKELDITVRLAQNRRNNLEDLLDLNISSPIAGTIQLRDIAEVKTIENPATIEKENKSKTISVGMNLNGIDLGGAATKLREIASEYQFPSGITYEVGGNNEMMQEVFGQLLLALGIAIFLIYFILASQFESFVQPFIIMGTVPLALIGVFIGVVATGTPFNIMVMVGVILLAGIVVNNGIVLVDHVNILIEQGVSRYDALIESGRTRIRPIMMTTLTTGLGWIPLAVATGEGTEYYKGMAIAVIFGLAFSSLLTLLYIPVVYSLLGSVKDLFGRIKQKKWNKNKKAKKKLVSGKA